MPDNGVYMLSWAGTAQGRVYQSGNPAYNISPIATGLGGGINTTIEFSAGTVSQVQFEMNGVATAFERRDDELQRCRRYYRTGFFAITIPGIGGKEVGYGISFEPPMSAAPTVSLFTDYRYNSTAANELVSDITAQGFRIKTVADNTDLVNIIGRWFAAREI